jgi:hypothetical protein
VTKEREAVAQKSLRARRRAICDKGNQGRAAQGSIEFPNKRLIAFAGHVYHN